MNKIHPSLNANKVNETKLDWITMELGSTGDPKTIK